MRKKLRRRRRSNCALPGDLIDLTQEHDPQDILRAAVQEDVKRVINTTVGRVIFNDSIPAGLPFFNGTLKKKGLQSLVNYSHIRLGHEMTVKMLDDLKTLGFLYATKRRHLDRHRRSGDAAGEEGAG